MASLNQSSPVSSTPSGYYYYSLAIYTPVCFRNQPGSSPCCLMNKDCGKSLVCLGVIDVIFGLVIGMFIGNANFSEHHYGQSRGTVTNSDKLMLVLIDLGLLLCINISFLLTQFLNPGIRNPQFIPADQFAQYGRFWCNECNKPRSGEMTHCEECEVCVKDLDHHCGFFAKCIAGAQRFAFYAFLTFMFCGFLMLIVSLSSAMGL